MKKTLIISLLAITLLKTFQIKSSAADNQQEKEALATALYEAATRGNEKEV